MVKKIIEAIEQDSNIQNYSDYKIGINFPRTVLMLLQANLPEEKYRLAFECKQEDALELKKYFIIEGMKESLKYESIVAKGVFVYQD